jgi:hypothetical protein
MVMPAITVDASNRSLSGLLDILVPFFGAAGARQLPKALPVFPV